MSIITNVACYGDCHVNLLDFRAIWNVGGDPVDRCDRSIRAASDGARFGSPEYEILVVESN